MTDSKSQSQSESESESCHGLDASRRQSQVTSRKSPVACDVTHSLALWRPKPATIVAHFEVHGKRHTHAHTQCHCHTHTHNYKFIWHNYAAQLLACSSNCCRCRLQQRHTFNCIWQTSATSATRVPQETHRDTASSPTCLAASLPPPLLLFSFPPSLLLSLSHATRNTVRETIATHENCCLGTKLKA